MATIRKKDKIQKIFKTFEATPKELVELNGNRFFIAYMNERDFKFLYDLQKTEKGGCYVRIGEIRRKNEVSFRTCKFMDISGRCIETIHIKMRKENGMLNKLK